MASIANPDIVPGSQAELLYQAQLRKERSFRMHVGISWGVLFFILIFLFSGQTIELGAFRYEGPTSSIQNLCPKRSPFCARVRTNSVNLPFCQSYWLRSWRYWLHWAGYQRFRLFMPSALFTFLSFAVHRCIYKYFSFPRPATVGHYPFRHRRRCAGVGIKSGAYMSKTCVPG